MKKNLFIKLVTAALAASTALTPMSVLAAPKTMPDGGVFDSAYYASKNPDVVQALGIDDDALYQHYLKYGKAEGRLPYAPDNRDYVKSLYQDNFDPTYYAKNNPDVVAAVGNDPNSLYQHYLTYGKKEGRLPCAPKLTDAEVTAKLLALKSKYPEGMHWDSNSYYDRVYTDSKGRTKTMRIYACAGFAYQITDEVFGADTPTVTITPKSTADLKPGDIMSEFNHAMVVVSIDDQNILAVDGNDGGEVTWGDISRERHANMSHAVITRRVTMND